MKKSSILFATILFSLVVAIGCKKIISKIFSGFDTALPEIVVTIPYYPIPPGTPVPQDEISLGSFTQDFNLDSIIQANTAGAFGADDVHSVKIKKMVFSILNADANNNLANFKSARFAISSNSNSTPVNIASFTFDDSFADAQTYNAPSDAPDLISYLKGTRLTYYSYAKIRRFTTKELKVSVLVTITAY